MIVFSTLSQKTDLRSRPYNDSSSTSGVPKCLKRMRDAPTRTIQGVKEIINQTRLFGAAFKLFLTRELHRNVFLFQKVGIQEHLAGRQYL